MNSYSFVHFFLYFLLTKLIIFFWYFTTCDSKLSLSAGPAYIAFCLHPASLLSPSVKGDLEPCRHSPCSVICFWWLWCIRGSGPWGSLFVWAMCSRSLQSWQESFTAKTHCVFGSTLTHKSLLFIYFFCPGQKSPQWGKVGLPSPGSLCVCVCLCTGAIEWACSE